MESRVCRHLSIRGCTIRRIFLLNLLFAALVAVMYSEAGASDFANGFQWWSDIDFEVPMSRHWSVIYQQEFRMGEDGRTLYYFHSDIGLIYEGLAEWLGVGLNYRQVYQKDDAGDFQPENRPHLNVVVKDSLGRIRWSNRSRVEYRDRTTGEDTWRYRNLTTLRLPVELLGFEPYVADEVFINTDGTGYAANRLYAGGTLALGRNVEFDLYYLWESSPANGGTDNIQALGTALAFRF